MSSAGMAIPDLSTLVGTGRWTHPPVAAVLGDGTLMLTAAEGSDAWRHTSYGFVHDTEHALLAPFAVGTAVEVEFTAGFAAQFDQAGVFVRASEETWVKAGVEFADGQLQLGAVVTDGRSDWSVAPVPGWLGSRVLIRVSRGDDALTVRAAVDGGALQNASLPPRSNAEHTPTVYPPFAKNSASWRVTSSV